MLGFRRVRVPAIAIAPSPAEASLAAATGPCANCGDASPGRFCPSCGQERRTRLVSLREMAVDFLDDQLALNSRLPRTALFLLVRPGFLTAEYLRGRIARYIRPLRLYLGASVLFFLLLSLLDSGWLDAGAADGGGVRVAVEGDTIPLVSALAGSPAAGAARPWEVDGSWVDSLDVRTAVPALDGLLEEKRAHFRRMTPGEAFREVMGQFREHVPTMMFLLLPVFALLLKLLYARRGRLYVEHFVFALHLHAFAFAAFTVMLLARHPTVAGVLTLWVLLYTFLAMRRVYGQGWMRTGVKYLVLGWSYSIVLTLALAVTAVVTLLLV
ncbi:MAG TPA: DUF3667 domain-containing protein [Longimicrobiaceae bacterium]|nr:DUF3667 domain-containing protein [Longimicrobiaceae bacterium]